MIDHFPSDRPTSCFAQSKDAQEICEHVNQINTSDQPIYFPLSRSSHPTPEERALDWTIRHHSPNEHSMERVTQRFALASLFFRNEVKNEQEFAVCRELQNWTTPDVMESTHECDWFGSAVNCTNGLVKKIRIGLDADWISGYSSLRCFVGSLPPNLALLSRLTVLSMNGQDFRNSTIPESYYSLKSLEELSLGSSSIAGTISPALNKLTKLRHFDVSRNLISGQIPASLQLTNIETIRLERNRLSGNIPAFDMTFDKVKELRLEGNSFTGSIPSSIGHMKNLEHLEIQDNSLTGKIPDEFASLVNLLVFLAFGNTLDGETNLCSSGRTFVSLVLDCDRVDCPCCTNCCRPGNVGEPMCMSTVCRLCNSTFLDGCSLLPNNVDVGWQERITACSCECRR